jgi:predicted glutamine amidotransferase
MSSPLPTNVSFSLAEFARHGGGSATHKDGWGIAFYQGADALIVLEP